MNRSLRFSAALFVIGMLQGCVATFTPAPTDVMVTVKSVGFGTPQICKDGQMYWPPVVKDVPGAVSVPAGARLTIGAHIVSEGYQVVHYCRPFLSFVPTAGNTYLMNSALSGEGRCAVELVREDLSKSAGVALEPSVDRASCSPK
jgi:hypothetical protein